MANAQAFESGYQQGYGAMEQRHAHKQALSDQELEGKIQDEIGKRQAIIEKYPSLTGTDKDEADKSLIGIAQNLRTLYHPDHNPTAIQKFGHLLTDHLGIKVNDPTIGQKVSLSDARKGKEYDKQQKLGEQDKATAQGWQAGAGLSPEQQAAAGGRAKFAEFSAKLKTMNDLWDQQNPNPKPEDKKSAYVENARTLWEQEFVTPQKGNNKPDIQQLTLSDGTQVSAQWVSDPSLPLKGKWQHLNGDDIESSLLAGAKVTSKPAKLSGPQLLQDSYIATLKLPFGTSWDTLTPQQREGYQLYLNKLKQRSSNHQAAITDRDGNVHVVDLSSSSGPIEVSSPNSPQSNGGGKPHSQGGSSKTPTRQDIVLNFKKATPDYTKAKNTYNDTNRITLQGDNWLNHHSSEADQNFVLALIKSEAGRVNQQEIASIFDAGGITEGPDRWAAKIGHGELPQELRTQIVDFLHNSRDAAKQVLDEMNGSTPNSSGIPKDATHIFHSTDDNKDYYVDEQGNNLGEVTK